MESYFYKLSYDSVLLDQYLGSHSHSKYNFMIDVFKESPDLLTGYLPYFKDELQVNDKVVRYKAVSMFAKLFSMGHINLAIKEPELWILYLERFRDQSVKVRRMCVKSSAAIVASWPQLFDDLMAHMAEIQGDSSSLIRMEIVEALKTIVVEDFDLVCSNNEFWEVLKTRNEDVKDSIRKKVRSILNSLYKMHLINPKVELIDRDKFDWIVRELGESDNN